MQSFGARLKNLCKRNSNSIMLVLVMAVANAILVALKIQTSGYPFLSKHSLLIYAILFFITTLIIFLLYKAKKNSWKIEIIFLICGITLGISYSLFIPIGGAPDEPAHFWRAYELSEGKIFAQTDSEGNTGIYLPDNLQELTTNKYSVSKNSYQPTINNFSEYISDNYILDSTPGDSYAPFNYLPQIVGIWIGRILHLPFVPIFYLSRLFNMIMCITVIYFCIKYIPIMKKLIFLVGLFPMTMQLFSSVSADGSIICAGMALITFVLYAQKTMKRRINIKDILLLTLICLTLVVSKPVYAFLCPILFWIPKERFKSIKHKYAIIILLGLFVLALVLLRLFVASSGEAKYDSSAQISFILANPIIFTGILFKNVFLSPYFFTNSAIGQSLEWFSVGLCDPYILTFLLFFAFLCAEREAKITRSLKAFVFCSFFIIIISTFTLMFIQWTEPGLSTIDGVQGRYFLPIILLIPLFCLPTKKPKKKQIVKSNYLYIFATLANVYAIMMIFCTHI